jgi:6-pyruvoyl-tetrahydropterin synthase
MHGHNATVDISFSGGEFDYAPEAMIIDFSKIKEVVSPILELIDHKNLNTVDVPDKHFFLIPTAENIVRWLKVQIEKTPIGAHLCGINFFETDNCWITWSKE